MQHVHRMSFHSRFMLFVIKLIELTLELPLGSFPRKLMARNYLERLKIQVELDARSLRRGVS